jgi:flagellar hook-length control protein FliK
LLIDSLAVAPVASGPPGSELRRLAGKDSKNNLEQSSFSETLSKKVEQKEIAPNKSSRDAVVSVEKEKNPQSTAPPGEKANEPVQGQQRQEAIRKFMDSFESEFGISPTRIVEAMAAIKPSMMNQPPEQSAVDVIEQLDLDAEEIPAAEAMYMSLLSQLQQIGAPGPQKYFMPPETLSKEEVQLRAVFAQDRKAQMNQSVQKLNENFWMTQANADFAPRTIEDFSKEPLNEESLFGAENKAADFLVDKPVDKTMEKSTLLQAEKSAGAKSESMLTQDAAVATTAAAAPLQSVLSEMKQAAERAKIESALQKTQILNPPNSLMAQNLSQQAQQDFSQQFGNSSSQNGAEGLKLDQKSVGTTPEISTFSALMPSSPAPLRMDDLAAALKAAGGLSLNQMAPPTNEQKEVNLNQLINQAQYLIKKGGGEMKVQMTPEGLGPIQLKVDLSEGKLNIQVAAGTSEAKKMIESSLPELKSSLAAQRLSVDHIKVDVVSAASAETQTRGEANTNSNSQHRNDRQFWNQFQENFGNRSSREGMWEAPDLKGYRRAKDPEPLQPLQTTSSARKALRVDGRGSGLNLVA